MSKFHNNRFGWIRKTLFNPTSMLTSREVELAKMWKEHIECGGYYGNMRIHMSPTQETIDAYMKAKKLGVLDIL